MFFYYSFSFLLFLLFPCAAQLSSVRGPPLQWNSSQKAQHNQRAVEPQSQVPEMHIKMQPKDQVKWYKEAVKRHKETLIKCYFDFVVVSINYYGYKTANGRVELFFLINKIMYNKWMLLGWLYAAVESSGSRVRVRVSSERESPPRRADSQAIRTALCCGDADMRLSLCSVAIPASACLALHSPRLAIKYKLKQILFHMYTLATDHNNCQLLLPYYITIIILSYDKINHLI